jgi:hypothetical protein
MLTTDMTSLSTVAASRPNSMLALPPQAIWELWQEENGDGLVVVAEQLVIALINVLHLGLMQLTIVLIPLYAKQWRVIISQARMIIGMAGMIGIMHGIMV